MEALRNASPSPANTIGLSRNGIRYNHYRFHHCFLSCKQSVNCSALRSIGMKEHRTSWPIAASASVSQESVQTELGESVSESQNQATDETKTVRVRFLLRKECSFGEQFVLVGDGSAMGLWDPESGIPLDWSEGHLWAVELDIPVGKPIKYKFILKGFGGKLLWQPDPDRVLETWETMETIVVLEDWEDPRLQNIVEEVQIAQIMVKEESVADEEDPKHAADSNSQILADADDNLDLQDSEPFSDVMEEQPKQCFVKEEHVANEVPEQIAEPGLWTVAEDLVPGEIEKLSTAAKTSVFYVDASSEEEPMSLIADNISYHQEEIYAANARHQLAEGSTTSYPQEEPTLTPSNITSDVDAKGSLSTVTNSTCFEINGTSGAQEGEPVLVPGLSPVPDTQSEETVVEESIALDDSVEGVADVRNPILIEITAAAESKREKVLGEVRTQLQQAEEEEGIGKGTEMKLPSASDVYDILQSYVRWMQKLLRNLGLV